MVLRLFRGTTNCDLVVPYKTLPPPSYPTFLPKLAANFLAIEKWATYFSRNCLPAATGGLPSAWCWSEAAASDGSDPWGGAILTVPADTMSPTGTALAVDVTVEMSFTVDATYEIEFSWTNSVNGQTMNGWGWREVVDVDTSSKFRQTWHCLVGVANLDADWELNAVVFGANAVTFATEFRAIEVNAATEACCQWSEPA